jgi:hypothetical protein
MKRLPPKEFRARQGVFFSFDSLAIQNYTSGDAIDAIRGNVYEQWIGKDVGGNLIEQ